MNTERLSRMLSDAVAIDLECHKFQPGLSVPPLVCGSLSRVVGGQIVGKLLGKTEIMEAFAAIIRDDRITIVNANIAVDMVLMARAFEAAGIDILPEIFAAYAADRVYCTLLAEALHHIGLGCMGIDPRTGKKFSDKGYGLELVHELVTGKSNAKVNDKWRCSYALLENIPVEKWREIAGPEAVDYPVDDTRNALEDALGQAGLIPNIGKHDFDGTVCKRCKLTLAAGLSPICVAITQRLNIHDLATQTYTAFAMQLGGAWGLQPDPVAVAKLKYEVTKDLAEDVKPFIAAGIVREDGSCNEGVLKKLMARATGSEGECPTCANTTILKGPKNNKQKIKVPGKVISAKTGTTLVNCPDCDGSGLHLCPGTPRTPSGEISCKRDHLMESGDELLMAYGQHMELAKVRSTYIPWLETGIDPRFHLEIPTKEDLMWCLDRIQAARWAGDRITTPICLSPNSLVETNRTSYRDKSQTQPREGGVRNCFVPDEGFGYYSCDYTGIELAAWAQICLWMFKHSEMAKALNQGINAHGKLGAQMCGMDYTEFMRLVKSGSPREKTFRQTAKWGNFGYMGGAGEIRIAMQVREQGPDTEHPTGPIMRKGKRVYKGTRFCLLIGGAQRCGEKMIREHNKKIIPAICAKCVECSRWLREAWFKTWPEATEYFARCKVIGQRGFQVHPTSKRLRGGIGYTDGANGFFQELAACGAKEGLREIVREQYDHTYRPADLNGERSILYNNSRNVAFLHDENFGVGRIELLPEVAERICVVMKKGMAPHIRDVLVEVEPTIMMVWYKEAAMVRDASGRLAIWQPKER